MVIPALYPFCSVIKATLLKSSKPAVPSEAIGVISALHSFKEIIIPFSKARSLPCAGVTRINGAYLDFFHIKNN
jgi:hypothetical protein